VDGKIDLRLAPALSTLDGLIANGQANQYDFVFIDADKPNYINYYDRALVLLRPGGLIGVDNVLWSGRVIDPAFDDPDTVAIRAFNEQLQNDDRVWLSMLPVRDGLTLACKK
jgi:predicted O-methyltransferase YrrM